jgi:hypothetical protein
MDFVQMRELVRVRYELRTLLAQDRRQEALPYLDKLRALAATDEQERATLEPEIARWECRCGRSPYGTTTPGQP